MVRSIEERVVEMRFDNKAFKKGAEETLGFLDRLKSSLNLPGSTKGFDNIDRAVKNVSAGSMQSLISNVESLAQRFSTLGIIGARVLENLTDSAMNLVNRGFNYVTNSIISGGIRRAMNIENAHFQLQALLKDEEKVQAVMDNAMTSVDGTAYAFDEAAKAAAQFAASGIQAGDEMLSALRGIVGVSAMTNSEFSGVAQIFNTVAGNGRLMGDQLLQLSSRGLNAASTIADFVNRVNSGTAEVDDNVKKLVRDFSKSTKITEGDIRDLVSKGAVNFKLFSAAMTEAFADSAERANETFTGALSNMKSALARIGAEFVSPLVEQNSALVGLFNSLRIKINDLKKGITTDWNVGPFRALSTRFSKNALEMADSLSKFIDNSDMSVPLKVLYNFANTVSNIAGGLNTMVAPVASSFSKILVSFTGDSIIKLSETTYELTKGFGLSFKQIRNVRAAADGLFNVFKLGADICFKLLKALIPINEPVASLGDLMITLAGDAGRALTKFTEWVRGSEKIRSAYQIISRSIQTSMTWLARFISKLYDFGVAVKALPISQKIGDQLIKIFSELGKIGDKAFEKLGSSLTGFKDKLSEIVPEDAEVVLQKLLDLLEEVGNKILEFDTSTASTAIGRFIGKANELLNILKGSKNLNEFLSNMATYFKNVGKAITSGKLFEHLDKFWNLLKDIQKGFVTLKNWLKGNLEGLFDDFTVGGAFSAISGISMLASIQRLTTAIEKTLKSVKAIPDVFGALKGALIAFQDNLRADTLTKIGKALLLLAAALVVMSFADTDKVLKASASLSMIAGVLLGGTTALLTAIQKNRKTIEAVGLLTVGLQTVLKKFGKSMEIWAYTKLIKAIAAAVLEIVAAVVIIAVAYRKDSDAMSAALWIVAGIATGMLAFITTLALIGTALKSGTDGAMKAGIAMAAIAASLLIVVFSLNKLFKMQLPEDWGKKLIILTSILLGLTALAILVGLSSNAFGDGTLKFGAMLSVSAALYVVVKSMDKLFKMQLPEDWGKKLIILSGIFVGIALIYVAMAAANKIAGGSLQAAGSILAMAVFVAVVVGALAILMSFDSGKLLAGAVSLGLILVALGAALAGAGKVSKENSFKSVMAMAALVAVITASLGVLSFVPMSKLMKSVVILGSMLLILAADFKAVSMMTSQTAYKAIWALVGAIAVISVALIALATQPWEGLLAGTVALGGVMFALAETLKIIASAKFNTKQLVAIGVAVSALILVAVSLYALATQPWEGLLAGAAGISLTLVAIAAALKIASSVRPNMQAMTGIAMVVIAMAAVAVALYVLADQPWQNLLAAGTAVSEVMLAMSVAMGICAVIGSTVAAGVLPGIAALDLFIANIALVLAALGALAQNEQVTSLIHGGMDLLFTLAEAIGGFVGHIISGFGVGLTDGLPAIADNLSEFSDRLSPFMESMESIDPKMIEGVKNLAEAVLILTAADLIERLTGPLFGSNSFSKFAKELEDMAPAIVSFSTQVEGIKSNKVSIAANAIKMLAEAAEALPDHGGMWQSITGDSSLVSFAWELDAMAPAIVSFAEQVKGIEADAADNAAAVANTMREVAENLPDHGGAWQAFIGDSSLTSFAMELVSFAPSLVLFSLLTKDIPADAADNAAAVANTMREVAENLPDHGGAWQAFTGDNSLRLFGKDMVAYGELVMDFADEIVGLSPNAASGARTVGMAMSELANSLPSHATLMEKIFGGGTITLAAFGEQLIPFGESIAIFADSIRGIKASNVDGVKSITEVMVALANDVPTSGGLLSVLFGGNGIGRFGEDLADFGKAFTAFYKETSNIDASAMDEALDEIQRIIKLIDGLKDIDTDTILEFGKAMRSIPTSMDRNLSLNIQNAGVSAVRSIEAFFGSVNGTVISRSSSLGSTMSGSLNRGLMSGFNALITSSLTLTSGVMSTFTSELDGEKFRVIGESTIDFLSEGVASKKPLLDETSMTLSASAVDIVKTQMKPSTLSGIGSSAISGLSNGIMSKKPDVVSSASTIGSSAVNSTKSSLTSSEMHAIGSYAGQGLADGLRSKLGEVQAAAAALADAASKTTRRVLEVRSPSRVMTEIGGYTGEGFVLGLLKWITGTERTAEELGESVVEPIRNAIKFIYSAFDQEFDLNPVITPTVDLSEVSKGAYETSQIFSRGINLSRAYETAMQTAAAFNASQPQRQSFTGGDRSNEREPVTTQFIQNNYSPKALSRSDIYRNTKNLFSQAKGVSQT